MSESSQTSQSIHSVAAYLALSANFGLVAGLLLPLVAAESRSLWFWLLPLVPAVLLLPLPGALMDRFGSKEWFGLILALALTMLAFLNLLFGFRMPAWLVWAMFILLFLLANLCHKAQLSQQEPEEAGRLARLDLTVITGSLLLCGLANLLPLETRTLWWIILAICLVLLVFYYVTFGAATRQLEDKRRTIAEELQAFAGSNPEYSDAKSFLVVLFPAMVVITILLDRLILLTETTDGWFADPTRGLIFLTAAFAGCFMAGRMSRTFGFKRSLTLSFVALTLLICSLALAGHTFWLYVCAVLAIYFVAQALSGLPGIFAVVLASDKEGQGFAWYYVTLIMGFGTGLLVSFLAMGLSLFQVTFPIMLLVLLLFQNVKARRFRRSPVIRDEEATELDWEESPSSGLAAHTFTSRLLQSLARTLAEIFFGKLRIHGRENIRIEAGTIFVANHPNTFLDPLLVTALAPGRVHYWAKSTLWKFPLLGSILDRLGAIPIHRRQDAGGSKRDNSGSMDAAANKLNQYAHVLIFPEGVSEPGLSLKPIKTGAARLGFQAITANDWQEEVYIVPIALDYSEPTLFRSPVTVRIGEAVALSKWRDEWEENNREAVLQVTGILSEQLKNMLPHLDDPQLETLVKRIHRLYGERVLQILEQEDETTARKAISDAVNHYQKMDPDTLYLFYERLETYFLENERLSTPENHPPIPLSALLKILASFLSFASYGLVTNWLPYRFTGKLVEWFGVSTVWMASAKLAFGAVTFGTYYLIIGFLTWQIAGPFATGLLLFSMLLSAFIAMGAIDRFAFRFSQLRTLWQAFWTQDTNEDLEAMKVSLIQDLERFRESYAFYVAKETD